MLKQLLIPVAAFAITATGVSAFNSDYIKNLDVDLTDTQISALEEVDTIRAESKTRINDVLENAGIDKSKMQEIHKAMQGARKENHEAVEAAFEANDYQAFLTAIADSPMADRDISADDFAKMAEAHELMESGDREGAKAIFDELGLEGRGMGMGKGMGGGHRGGGFGGNDQD